MTYNTSVKSAQFKGNLWQSVGGASIVLIASGIDTRSAVLQLVSGGKVAALVRLNFRRVCDLVDMVTRAEQTGHIECRAGSYSVAK